MLTYSLPNTGDQYSGYYSIQISEPSGCNDLKVFFYDNVLCTLNIPVKLLNFDVEKVKATSKLTWSTSSEINSRNFLVERSANGRTNWSVIGDVPAAGNSLVKRNYNFTDKSPLSGGNYYRLKMIDNDGTYKFTDLRYVDFSDKAQTINVFPNPTNSVINIEGLSAGNNVKIINILGTVLADFNNVSSSQLKIDISTFANGVYFVTTSDGQTIKFVKQ